MKKIILFPEIVENYYHRGKGKADIGKNFK